MDRYYKKGQVINGYSILKKIGEGRYGIAYLAINDKGEKCVIKQLKKHMLKKTRQKLFYEEQILKKLDSYNFPRFISKFKDKDREGYLLEYIDGKVFEKLLTKEGHQFTRQEIYKVAGQLIDLAEELHKNNIVHRDIRLPNVIINEDGELSLIDFGLARFIDEDKYRKEIDYGYIGDFLIRLYYSSYEAIDSEEKPWFEELSLNDEERLFLKRLIGIEENYENIDQIREQLEKIKNIQ